MSDTCTGGLVTRSRRPSTDAGHGGAPCGPTKVTRRRRRAPGLAHPPRAPLGPRATEATIPSVGAISSTYHPRDRPHDPRVELLVHPSSPSEIPYLEARNLPVRNHASCTLGISPTACAAGSVKGAGFTERTSIEADDWSNSISRVRGQRVMIQHRHHCCIIAFPRTICAMTMTLPAITCRTSSATSQSVHGVGRSHWSVSS